VFGSDSILTKADLGSALRNLRCGLLSKDSKVSEKTRINAFVGAMGLKSCFAPRVVYESIKKDTDGVLISVSTGRDGRVIHVGKTNKSLRYLTEGMGKFSSPWSSVSKLEKWKAARFSYISVLVARMGLPEKAIKPLVRFASQFWKLGKESFKRFARYLVALISSGSMVRRTTGRDPLKQFKPTLTGSVKILEHNLGSVPLWDWRPPKGNDRIRSNPGGNG
jgi:hypothetical protein